MESIFNLLSLFYAFRSLRLAMLVAQHWSELKEPAFPPQRKRLAEQASFFLAVPISVFFHEGAHALAVYAFGGDVLEFGYRVFWGFVVPGGDFTPPQNWFIALAGTLGSLLFGVVLWGGLRQHKSPTFRYFALRALRYQIQFSLIYYPVLTLLGFYGDWRYIYDFGATPLLSSLTAVGHVLILGAALLAERRGFFQMASFENELAGLVIRVLESSASAGPQDVAEHLRLFDAHIQGGATRRAAVQLEALLKEHPYSAEGYLRKAYLAIGEKNRIPSQARDSARKALSLNLDHPASVASAYEIMGQYALGVEKVEEAIGYFDQALAAAEKGGNAAQLAQLSYLRALGFRRKGNYEAAHKDATRALKLAQDGGLDNLVAFYQMELETIARHAGWS